MFCAQLRSNSSSLSSSSFYSARNYSHERTVLTALAELYGTIDHSEQGVVFADTYVLTRVVLGATLTHDDVASNDGLTTENFHAETLRMRFTTVVRATYAFLVCHGIV